MKEYSLKITGYCYHAVNVITFSLPQIDHIKWLQLSFIGFTLTIQQFCCPLDSIIHIQF